MADEVIHRGNDLKLVPNFDRKSRSSDQKDIKMLFSPKNKRKKYRKNIERISKVKVESYSKKTVSKKSLKDPSVCTFDWIANVLLNPSQKKLKRFSFWSFTLQWIFLLFNNFMVDHVQSVFVPDSTKMILLTNPTSPNGTDITYVERNFPRYSDSWYDFSNKKWYITDDDSKEFEPDWTPKYIYGWQTIRIYDFDRNVIANMELFGDTVSKIRHTKYISVSTNLLIVELTKFMYSYSIQESSGVFSFPVHDILDNTVKNLFLCIFDDAAQYSFWGWYNSGTADGKSRKISYAGGTFSPAILSINKPNWKNIAAGNSFTNGNLYMISMIRDFKYYFVYDVSDMSVLPDGNMPYTGLTMLYDYDLNTHYIVQQSKTTSFDVLWKQGLNADFTVNAGDVFTNSFWTGIEIKEIRFHPNFNFYYLVTLSDPTIYLLNRRNITTAQSFLIDTNPVGYATITPWWNTTGGFYLATRYFKTSTKKTVQFYDYTHESLWAYRENNIWQFWAAGNYFNEVGVDRYWLPKSAFLPENGLNILTNTMQAWDDVNWEICLDDHLKWTKWKKYYYRKEPFPTDYTCYKSEIAGLGIKKYDTKYITYWLQGSNWKNWFYVHLDWMEWNPGYYLYQDKERIKWVMNNIKGYGIETSNPTWITAWKNPLWKQWYSSSKQWEVWKPECQTWVNTFWFINNTWFYPNEPSRMLSKAQFIKKNSMVILKFSYRLDESNIDNLVRIQARTKSGKFSDSITILSSEFRKAPPSGEVPQRERWDINPTTTRILEKRDNSRKTKKLNYLKTVSGNEYSLKRNNNNNIRHLISTPVSKINTNTDSSSIVKIHIKLNINHDSSTLIISNLQTDQMAFRNEYGAQLSSIEIPKVNYLAENDLMAVMKKGSDSNTAVDVSMSMLSLMQLTGGTNPVQLLQLANSLEYLTMLNGDYPTLSSMMIEFLNPDLSLPIKIDWPEVDEEEINCEVSENFEREEMSWNFINNQVSWVIVFSFAAFFSILLSLLVICIRKNIVRAVKINPQKKFHLPVMNKIVLLLHSQLNFTLMIEVIDGEHMGLFLPIVLNIHYYNQTTGQLKGLLLAFVFIVIYVVYFFMLVIHVNSVAYVNRIIMNEKVKRVKLKLKEHILQNFTKKIEPGFLNHIPDIAMAIKNSKKNLKKDKILKKNNGDNDEAEVLDKGFEVEKLSFLQNFIHNQKKNNDEIIKKDEEISKSKKENLKNFDWFNDDKSKNLFNSFRKDFLDNAEEKNDIEPTAIKMNILEGADLTNNDNRPIRRMNKLQTLKSKNIKKNKEETAEKNEAMKIKYANVNNSSKDDDEESYPDDFVPSVGVQCCSTKVFFRDDDTSKVKVKQAITALDHIVKAELFDAEMKPQINIPDVITVTRIKNITDESSQKKPNTMKNLKNKLLMKIRFNFLKPVMEPFREYSEITFGIYTPIIMILKNLLIIIFLVVYAEKGQIQIILILCLEAAYAIYLLVIRPYEEKADNFISIYNGFGFTTFMWIYLYTFISRDTIEFIGFELHFGVGLWWIVIFIISVNIYPSIALLAKLSLKLIKKSRKCCCWWKRKTLKKDEKTSDTDKDKIFSRLDLNANNNESAMPEDNKKKISIAVDKKNFDNVEHNISKKMLEQLSLESSDFKVVKKRR